VPYLSASAVVIHYEEALYQVYAPLPWPLPAIRPLPNYTAWRQSRVRKRLAQVATGSAVVASQTFSLLLASPAP